MPKTQLRAECIDSDSPDPVLKRIAYAMEEAIRRVTEPVVGWGSLPAMARSNAVFGVHRLRGLGNSIVPAIAHWIAERIKDAEAQAVIEARGPVCQESL